MKSFNLIALSLVLVGCGMTSTFGPVDNQGEAVPHTVQVGWDGNFYEFPQPLKDPGTGKLIEQPIDSMKGYSRVRPCYADRNSQDCKDGIVAQYDVTTDGIEGVLSSLDDFYDPALNDKCGLTDEDYRDGKKRRVAIYVHGGLNSREPALERVIEKVPDITSDCVYPIFINWRSSGPSALKDHYFRIRGGEVSRAAPYNSPIYMIGDLFRTVGSAPLAWWKEGNHAWESSVGRDTTNAGLMQVPAEYKHMVNFSPLDQDVSSTGRTTLWWVTSPVKVLSTPAIYSLGKPAWDNMQRRVDTQFVKPVDFLEPAESGAGVAQVGVTDSFAGTAATLRFARALQASICVDESYEITLIGHSMGSVVVNRILRNVPDFRADNIVHMASADTVENLLHTTINYTKDKKHPIAVYSLHLHPENEDRETRGYGLLPSGSLLVWIDNAYGDPDYTLQRTAGRWSNMRQALPLFHDSVNGKMNFTVFGRSRDECEQPQSHGAFDECDFKFWDESFWLADVSLAIGWTPHR